MKILLATSEAYPLIKTGGLGDVCGSLPLALRELDCDVRVILPAYRDARAKLGSLKIAARLQLEGSAEPVTLLEGMLPNSTVPVWLVDCPALFDRAGNPYVASDGRDWPDNAQRFALLCRAVVKVALNRAQLNWVPDIVHCNDWQTGLVPTLLRNEASRPATLFTLHNLAYQGVFQHEVFTALNLDPALWSSDALEFYNQMSFIKGGLIYSDRITTVSPNYAREIQTPEFGCGLDGLLRQRAGVLHGIVNGIDSREWNPETDTLIAKTFSAATFTDKQPNKVALQKEFNLPQQADRPLIGMVGRLVHQKGVDLVLDAMSRLIALPVQLVILGSGEATLASQLQTWARRLPQQLAVRIGYDEALAHRIEAGADMFLMPSRFEPCGLNQLYSLRYGTIPLVRRVGGLADTVVDVTTDTLRNNRATGFMIEQDSAQAVVDTVQRAVKLYADRAAWTAVAVAGMRQDLSWRNSARGYLSLYDDLVRSRTAR